MSPEEKDYEFLTRIMKLINIRMSIRERLQLIQKIAELSVQELIILEAEDKAKSP